MRTTLPWRLRIFEKFPTRPQMVELRRVSSEFPLPKVRQSFTRQFAETDAFTIITYNQGICFAHIFAYNLQSIQVTFGFLELGRRRFDDPLYLFAGLFFESQRVNYKLMFFDIWSSHQEICEMPA